jgi:hypothetical protein
VRNRLAAAWAWLYRSPDRAAIAIRTAIQTLSGGLVAWWVADGEPTQFWQRRLADGDVVEVAPETAAASAAKAKE